MPRNKKKNTAQSQNMLVQYQYDILDEIFLGDTKMRLVSVSGSEVSYIQLWSSLSKQWNTTHKYNVPEEWEKWKTYASVYNEKQGNGGRTKSDPKSQRKRTVARKKPSVDTGTDISANRKRGRRSAVKDR